MASDYNRKRQKEAHKTWINQLVGEIQAQRWYGSLTLIFEDGEVKRARKDQSLFPPNGS